MLVLTAETHDEVAKCDCQWSVIELFVLEHEAEVFVGSLIIGRTSREMDAP